MPCAKRGGCLGVSQKERFDFGRSCNSENSGNDSDSKKQMKTSLELWTLKGLE